jgi:hypothetical protein
VHSVKQIIGRSFSDAVVARTLAQRSWGFKVSEGPAGDCRITGKACGAFHCPYMPLRCKPCSPAVITLETKPGSAFSAGMCDWS